LLVFEDPCEDWVCSSRSTHTFPPSAREREKRSEAADELGEPSDDSVRASEMTRAEIIGNWDDLLNKAENGDSYLRLLAKCNEQKKVYGELGNFPGRGFESAWASFTRAIEHAHKRGVVRSALVTVTKDFQDSLPPREGLILAPGMRAYCLADKFRTIASAAVAKNKFRRPVHIGGARALAIRYNADVPAVGTAKAEEAQIAVLLATKSGWADPENQARAAEFYGP